VNQNPVMGQLPITPVLEKESVFTDTELRFLGELNNAHERVPKLVVLWLNLIITNFVVFAVANIHTGFILGIISPLLILPVSIAISKFAGHSALLNVLIGVLIFAMTEGGIAYLLDGKQGVEFGFLYGALYGASLPSYFSAKSKHTNLFWGALSTLFLVAGIAILAFTRYGIISCFSTIVSFIGNALIGAIITIILGLLMIPLLPHYIRRIESFLEGFVDLAKYEQGK
jgi:hypothetical protein